MLHYIITAPTRQPVLLLLTFPVKDGRHHFFQTLTQESDQRFIIRRGDLFRHIVAGAGGFGDPWVRDPERVLEDVKEGKITIGHARQAYGVVIDEDTMSIDEADTRRVRAKA